MHECGRVISNDFKSGCEARKGGKGSTRLPTTADSRLQSSQQQHTVWGLTPDGSLTYVGSFIGFPFLLMFKNVLYSNFYYGIDGSPCCKKSPLDLPADVKFGSGPQVLAYSDFYFIFFFNKWAQITFLIILSFFWDVPAFSQIWWN